MADTGAISPGTVANNSTVGTVAWDSTAEIITSDNTDAFVTLTGSPTTIDSYSETNQNTVFARYAAVAFIGQSFTNTNFIQLSKAKFYIRKIGSPTGNCKAHIYAHTGTFGSTGKPTGSPLATSDDVDVSTLPTSLTLTDFTFSGANKINLSASTKYCVAIQAAGADSSNGIEIGYDSTSPTHAGNGSFSNDSTGSAWNADNTYDVCFYVEGTSYVVSYYLRASNFGFSIPTGATINGIKVEIEQALDTGANAIESAVRIVKADGSIGTTNKSTGATVPSSDTYVTYGGASDLWGETWTSTDINDTDFGVVFSVSGTAGNTLVDHVRITVYYSTTQGGFFQIM